MPRKPRVWYPGATYHITARGVRKMDIFLDTLDFQTYLKYLLDVRARHPYTLHAYCLMNNHLHLQLETVKTPLDIIIKDLHSQYAIYFNKRYDAHGHVFQGRYGAEIIENYPYFLKVSSYIHLNPVAASMVKRPEDYRWSSYSAYIAAADTKNPYVSMEKTLSYFSAPHSANPQKPPRQHYKAFVEALGGQAQTILVN
ncbi:transposase [Heyndrickxia acidicola]|uniref:Transposase n=1 Tax=Heyndrickxia acidicola TaxID=209389 RepID=A0ABU6MJW7_9BACI|nr:transposase [Heyndrickxia acidicola]MED1204648.1 transposase [Heyndrickxia acidicola]